MLTVEQTTINLLHNAQLRTNRNLLHNTQIRKDRNQSAAQCSTSSAFVHCPNQLYIIGQFYLILIFLTVRHRWAEKKTTALLLSNEKSLARWWRLAQLVERWSGCRISDIPRVRILARAPLRDLRQPKVGVFTYPGNLKAPFDCAEKKFLRTYSLVSFSLCRKCRCLTMIFVKSVEILRKFTIKAYLI